MQIHHATRLLRETCARKHLAINTEESYIHWLIRYAAFLKTPKLNPPTTTEQKIQDFLTGLALAGVSASTQNQAFNALLFFYRHGLKQELATINSLRARRPAALRHCPAREDVLQLLAHVSDIHRYPTSPSIPAPLSYCWSQFHASPGREPSQPRGSLTVTWPLPRRYLTVDNFAANATREPSTEASVAFIACLQLLQSTR